MNIQDLQFRNTFIANFPGDQTGSTKSRPTPQMLYSLVMPTPVPSPAILVWSEDAASQLNLPHPQTYNGDEAHFFSGNLIIQNMKPFATRYGGHQFGHWAGQLGDGRAISIAEILSPSHGPLEIQLKGAGPTPYSRRGDGRAVLRSSLREFLCSEAMHFLNVPTTRALCCVTTGDSILRDMFYDGHPADEPGAITTRVAPTFLRFGHFEILAANSEWELLRQLVNYTIKNYFPECSHQSEEDIANWFSEVCKRTAKLMVHWMRVGFVHAVMNTDNMSILGLTIDYGPFSFLDSYDPDWTPNTTDAQNKRYRFGAQPEIGYWNIIKLAESLLGIVKDSSLLEKGLNDYLMVYEQEYLQMMADKLGLNKFTLQNDLSLLAELDQVLRSEEIDMTIFFRKLSEVRTLEDLIFLKEAYYSEDPEDSALEKMRFWLIKYLRHRNQDGIEFSKIQKKMNSVNPFFILRNYLIQEALDELEKGERGPLDSLMQAIKNPYEENEHTRPFFKKRPEWAKSRPGCSELSCSS
jgi:uncharacterized protein YdiU (UPF0061 family)